MFTTSTLKRLSISHLFSNGRSTSLLHTYIRLPSDFHSRVFGISPPPPPLLCVCVFHRYTKLNFLINSQISHAHPCMLWSLPQKSFSSLYLHKWTQLCKKEKLKYQVLAQWKGRKPKKKKKCIYSSNEHAGCIPPYWKEWVLNYRMSLST